MTASLRTPERARLARVLEVDQLSPELIAEIEWIVSHRVYLALAQVMEFVSQSMKEPPTV